MSGDDYTEGLRHRIAELEKIISGDSVCYQRLGITARDALILGAMIHREALTYDNINAIIISDPMDDSGGYVYDAIRHMIGRLRHRLQIHDYRIEIRAIRGRGYFMPAASKAIIAELVKVR